jgi:hypothetical protein
VGFFCYRKRSNEPAGAAIVRNCLAWPRFEGHANQSNTAADHSPYRGSGAKARSQQVASAGKRCKCMRSDAPKGGRDHAAIELAGACGDGGRLLQLALPTANAPLHFTFSGDADFESVSQLYEITLHATLHNSETVVGSAPDLPGTGVWSGSSGLQVAAASSLMIRRPHWQAGYLRGAHQRMCH